jgi:hypothetical protein
MRFFQRIRWILDGNSTLNIISINRLYIQMQTKLIYYQAEHKYFHTIEIKFNTWCLSVPAPVFCIFYGRYVLLAMLYSIHLLLTPPDISTEIFQPFKLFYTNISNHVIVFYHF